MASCLALARRIRPMATERMLLTEIPHVESSDGLFRNNISFINFPSPVAQRLKPSLRVGRAERHSLPRNSKAWLGGYGACSRATSPRRQFTQKSPSRAALCSRIPAVNCSTSCGGPDPRRRASALQGRPQPGPFPGTRSRRKAREKRKRKKGWVRPRDQRRGQPRALHEQTSPSRCLRSTPSTGSWRPPGALTNT